MTFENDKTREDIEQLAKRAEANIPELEALMRDSSNLPADLAELVGDYLKVSEDIVALAEQIREEK